MKRFLQELCGVASIVACYFLMPSDSGEIAFAIAPALATGLKIGGTILANKLFNKGSSGAIRSVSQSPFDSNLIQGFLPPSLRQGQVGGILQGGVQGIGDLIRNPGGLNPNVAQAILPSLSRTSENIATNFRGIGANQAGAAARGNLPVSIKNALSASLDVAQERAQRGARRSALTDSEELRRKDLSQVFQLLNTILQFTQSGRGGAITGIQASEGLNQQNFAANLASIGSILSGVGNSPRTGSSGVPSIGAFAPLPSNQFTP